MMDFFNDYRKLYLTALGLFVLLTILVAIMPAISNQNNNSPLPSEEPLSAAALEGKALYVANGCVACHTQQVRNLDMDKVWGKRPSIAADYADEQRTDLWRNTATLMGTERTGPDLADVGNRQPSAEWNLLHLYQPRAVVAESIMPAYPWLFEEKAELEEGDVEVPVPDAFRKGVKGRIVATKDALNLVAYLQSLKQAELPGSMAPPEFLYKREEKATATTGSGEDLGLDGAALYAANCQSCHQASGEGLKGAFPPLKGSQIVLDDNPEVLIDVVMNGYDARPEFASMPAIGTNMKLSAAEVAAIINHERSSWGNSARKVPEEEVQKIMDLLKQSAQK
ncbi:cbb3-type cytochrome c oxidase subunit II [Pontibacter sp. HSC-36F09]|uniref:cbb3-type cytochrome c oxidase subunit II n=1 Tax=Pontibacter sp. HSC-36F09 TaxID=2910966 RepID=UPI0020A08E7C|nr:cbb3-type cytochrome c oxidase subunit II [Pontibacter sp. HSC-36F09]MCP2044449.1 cytochrome c oxidase cbb3-type subunit 2 [Pontibacter sp. HSC-36F09]